MPFYLRTGKKLAEGQRIISVAFKEPPRSMFPAGSGVGQHGPDHLTFDLADQSRMSLSFYGKRPGPGMKLEKLSMQFATVDTTSTGTLPSGDSFRNQSGLLARSMSIRSNGTPFSLSAITARWT